MKVYYEIKEAIQKAAAQNLERDIRVGVAEEGEDFQIYLEEAEFLLTTTGENYIPENETEEHICSYIR